eukprot:s815_g19.t1
MLLGAVLFRSLPFVVYSGTLASLEPWQRTAQLGGVDWRVWVSGMVAGIARALLENPFEALKTQKQVWGTRYLDSLRGGNIWRGLSATCGRNVILVTMFFVLSDKLNRTDLPLLGTDLRDRPFLRGSCITVCCWSAAWPLDVVKSQMQGIQNSQVTHGCWSHKGVAGLLLRTWRGQMLYRGLLPGLVRACLANGSGMYAYQKEVEVVDYDGPRPDEEFLQAMRIELQESQHSLRRAAETIPYAYALQLSGKGLRLQKEEPVALERLVAVDVNQRSIHGYTSLHIASAAGNAEMVAFLLEMRADVSIASTYKSELPIHFAAQGGYDIVLRLLVEPTKAKGLLDVGTVTGWNALHLAVAGKHQNACLYAVAVSVQISHLAPIHNAATNGWPLHITTSAGHWSW